MVVWGDTDVNVCRQRMIDRGSDRDTWKLEHWDEYIATREFSLPVVLQEDGVVDQLLIFHNSSDEEFDDSMKEIAVSFEE